MTVPSVETPLLARHTPVACVPVASIVPWLRTVPSAAQKLFP